MRAYIALYVVVFVLSALVSYAVLSQGYVTTVHTITVTITTKQITAETMTRTLYTNPYAHQTATDLKLIEVPAACSIARPTTTEIIPSTTGSSAPKFTETTMVVAAVHTAEQHSVAKSGTGVESRIRITKLSEKGMIREYSAGRGIVKLLNASVKFATVTQNRSYIAIDLWLSASMPSKVVVNSVSVEPIPLPFGWNGSSWVVGFDEKHCLRRLSSLPSYSYRVEPQIIELEPGKTSSLHLELLFRGPIYGKYILVVRLSTGDTLELSFSSPNYRDPITPPPRELVELARSCGYSVGG